MAKDIDGNEIKVGDTVERIKPCNFTNDYGAPGDRRVVKDINKYDHIIMPGGWSTDGSYYRKVTDKAEPVFPFEAGDKVMCLNDAAAPGQQDGRLTRGKIYTVVSTSRLPRADIDSGTYSDIVVVQDNHGRRSPFHAARFCAPSQYPVVAKPVESAELVKLKDKLAQAEARIKDLVAQLDHARTQPVRLAAELTAARRVIQALARLAGVASGECLEDPKDGSQFVVLTREAK